MDDQGEGGKKKEKKKKGGIGDPRILSLLFYLLATPNGREQRQEKGARSIWMLERDEKKKKGIRRPLLFPLFLPRRPMEERKRIRKRPELALDYYRHAREKGKKRKNKKRGSSPNNNNLL